MVKVNKLYAQLLGIMLLVFAIVHNLNFHASYLSKRAPTKIRHTGSLKPFPRFHREPVSALGYLAATIGTAVKKI
jgi:hypothetical protein